MSRLIEKRLHSSDLRSRSTVMLLFILALGMLVSGLTQMPFAEAQNEQTLSLNPDHGYAGTVVNVTGAGFNSFIVDINFSGSPVTASLGFNTISAEFVVPSLPLGVYTVTASDSRGDKAETEFTITAAPFPPTAWQKEYGDGYTEALSNIIQTSDGGYAFLDLGSSHGVFNMSPSTFYKLNSSGDMQWTKVPANWFTARSLVQTRDGGYEISGEWNTYGSTYEYTPTIIKVDSEGNFQWDKNYSSVPNIGVSALSKIQTSDGGTASCEQEGSIVKTDANGNVQWTKNFTYQAPGVISSPLTFSSLIETSDGAILAIGIGVYRYQYGEGNIFLVKTDAFLPLPSQTPLPTPITTPITHSKPELTPAITDTALIVAIVAVSIGLITFRRHRKNTNSLQ